MRIRYLFHHYSLSNEEVNCHRKCDVLLLENHEIFNNKLQVSILDTLENDRKTR